jgi:hypothetical protein
MENKNSFKTLLYVIITLIVVIGIIVLLSKNKKNNSNENVVIGQATVDEINVSKSDTFPSEVNILAKGTLADSCTTLGDIKQNYENNKFIVSIESKRSINAKNCDTTLVPFEQNIALAGVSGLPKGSYLVEVNGVEGAFTLDMDNFINVNDPIK